eukprot:5038910-Amphidinium_carterae.1
MCDSLEAIGMTLHAGGTYGALQIRFVLPVTRGDLTGMLVVNPDLNGRLLIERDSCFKVVWSAEVGTAHLAWTCASTCQHSTASTSSPPPASAEANPVWVRSGWPPFVAGLMHDCLAPNSTGGGSRAQFDLATSLVADFI